MTVEVTDDGSDRVTEGEEHRRDGKNGKRSVLNISIQTCAEGLSNYVNGERWERDAGLWPSFTRGAECYHCELWSFRVPCE